jgi:hypothetical protein
MPEVRRNGKEESFPMQDEPEGGGLFPIQDEPEGIRHAEDG